MIMLYYVTILYMQAASLQRTHVTMDIEIDVDQSEVHIN
jgi:hypothetical protein